MYTYCKILFFILFYYIVSISGLELKHWKEMVENPRRPIVHWHVLKVYGEGGIFQTNVVFLMLHFKVYSTTLKRLKT